MKRWMDGWESNERMFKNRRDGLDFGGQLTLNLVQFKPAWNMNVRDHD